jgi:hypothetical protein
LQPIETAREPSSKANISLFMKRPTIIGSGVRGSPASRQLEREAEQIDGDVFATSA